ncbi:hypothetical protein CFN78_23585 [Amycolatopsis antarctica]|uniref:Uncharacterized protein n=1 Tax=Amycolatopsis antarctica TaxID=1854586 RepID=A0A263CWZ2_9PSEU|nr:hypothetical protein CFN78_23585 [Amycolatopsis antarctica]
MVRIRRRVLVAVAAGRAGRNRFTDRMLIGAVRRIVLMGAVGHIVIVGGHDQWLDRRRRLNMLMFTDTRQRVHRQVGQENAQHKHSTSEPARTPNPRLASHSYNKVPTR